MNTKIKLNREFCTGCKRCFELCPRVCFEMSSDGKAELVSDENCHSCGHCISVCPEGAISHFHFPLEDYQLISDKLDLSMVNGDQLYFFLKSLRSTRAFTTKPVKKEILEKLIDVVRYAPSGKLAQNVELLVINDPKTIQELKELSSKAIHKLLRMINNPLIRLLLRIIGKGQTLRNALKARGRMIRMQREFLQGKDSLFHGAPTIVIFHGPKQGIITKENCSHAASYLRVLAHGFNLGTCFIGYIENFAKYNPKIPKALKIPKGNRIFDTVIVGYPKYPFRTFVARSPAKVRWLEERVEE